MPFVLTHAPRRLAAISSLLLLLPAVACAPPAPAPSEPTSAPAPEHELARWQRRAAAVTIIRDSWGIPHIFGQTDADAVFGMIYAQAEDDFNRVEINYLTALGWLAQVEGESALYSDLRMRLFIDPEQLQRLYAQSPAWLVELMDAWADGLNYYLHTHPEVRARRIDRFEPWMALSFSEGSIGGDIERVDLDALERFYGGEAGEAEAARAPAEAARAPAESGLDEPSGSNGFAIAPRNSATGNALLLINPHTSFFFRAELHVVSEEGLDAYGATTWGQFFVYQGFNAEAGWMHTSSHADAIDWYLETVEQREGQLVTVHGDRRVPLTSSTITIPYASSEDGPAGERSFTVYHSHHGPIVAEDEGKWVAIALMQRPVDAIVQSFTRTKARDHAAFRATMALRTNSSNNTVYADSGGTIAYYHGNFVPRRAPGFDWDAPVDGSDPNTDWQGLHELDELISVVDPPVGWLANTNNWPFTVAGPDSPAPADYPRYMAPDVENPRGLHALAVLQDAEPFTLDSLIAAAYDPHLSAFERLRPALLDAYDELGKRSPLRAELAGPIALLRGWDLRNSVDSTATSLAICWGQELMDRVHEATGIEDARIYAAMLETPPAAKLEALRVAVARLQRDFGGWEVPWGEINRYQRIDGAIEQRFSDAAPSVPVAMASGRWGALASFGAKTYPGTRRMYGTSGNSFVAVVEFGQRVRAKAVTVGGQSGDPASPHFDDQVQPYVEGRLRDVWFYRADVEAHAERRYHPGE